MRKTWADLDKERQALPKPISRAEWARRSGISESTITKGLRPGTDGQERAPQKAQREKAELVLAAERVAIEGGLR